MKTFIATYSMTKYTQTITEGLKAENEMQAEQIVKNKGQEVVVYGIVEKTKQSYALPVPDWF